MLYIFGLNNIFITYSENQKLDNMKHFFTLIFCLVTLYTSAQKIENIQLTQTGGELLLQYDLTASSDTYFKVKLFYSSDKTNWLETDKAYGDVGDSIITGKNKKIVLWLDHLENIQTTMSFKIVGEYNTINEEKEGTLNDKNGNTYRWVLFGKNRWMTQNLKATNSDKDCGGLYTNSEARNACPDGWNLPSDEDWMSLEIIADVNEEKVQEHGLKEINLNKLKNAGFTIAECKYTASLYPNQKALAFWSSTENKMLYTGYSDKYLARIIRLDEGKISKELRNKSEKLSVRCVRSAVYLAKTEAIATKEIDLNPVAGVTHHPFSGEKLEWQFIGGNIWLKNDIKGSYLYSESDKACPVGWKVPVREDWENLLKEFNPGIELDNASEVLNGRLSSEGIWGFNFSNNDYWMDIDYYTYNTYWINENDKADSRKLREFLSNKRGMTTWQDKQTNEKAKVRCILDSEDFMTTRKSIKSGKFTDNRDNTEYGFVEIDGTVWMSDNLNYDMGENSKCRHDIKTECELFGHLYKIEVINNGCPDGWRLPTMEEWKYLLINKAANKTKILYPFGGTGFNLLLGDEVIFDNDGKTEIFTAKYLFEQDGKAGYYYIDSKGKVELNEKAKKRDYYYVRCVKK